MSLWKFWFVVAATPSTASVCYGPCRVLEDVTDYDGWSGPCSGLTNHAAETWEDCRDLCCNDLRCEVWQYASRGGTPGCQFGRGDLCGTEAAKQIVAAHGQRVMRGDIRVVVDNGNFSGCHKFLLQKSHENHGRPSFLNADLCRKQCYSQLDCTAWQVLPSGACYLGRAKGCVIGSLNQQVVAGQLLERTCPLGASHASPARAVDQSRDQSSDQHPRSETKTSASKTDDDAKATMFFPRPTLLPLPELSEMQMHKAQPFSASMYILLANVLLLTVHMFSIIAGFQICCCAKQMVPLSGQNSPVMRSPSDTPDASPRLHADSRGLSLSADGDDDRGDDGIHHYASPRNWGHDGSGLRHSESRDIVVRPAASTAQRSNSLSGMLIDHRAAWPTPVLAPHWMQKAVNGMSYGHCSSVQMAQRMQIPAAMADCRHIEHCMPPRQVLLEARARPAVNVQPLSSSNLGAPGLGSFEYRRDILRSPSLDGRSPSR